MKKKLIGVAVVAAIAVTAGWNFNQSRNEMKLSELGLANVEALAGCESSVKDDWGRSVTITCTNSHGESYNLQACDFDPEYPGKCQGRPAND